jgi:hypothetical protein
VIGADYPLRPRQHATRSTLPRSGALDDPRQRPRLPDGDMTGTLDGGLTRRLNSATSSTAPVERTPMTVARPLNWT